MREDRPFTPAVLLLFLSSMLHLAILAVPGPVSVPTMLVGAALLLALSLGLRQNWRPLGYVAFLFTLGGGIWALGFAVGNAGPQTWVAWGILAADWLAAATLFAALWAPAPSEFDA